MKPKMSVIVITYNTQEEYLKKCLDSIIKQSLNEIEIILVNDGSNNGAQEICTKYANQDNRIKLINQSNKGESVARNVGIENTTTDHIIFVDSDDWIEQETCQKVYQYISSINGNYDIIIFNCFANYRQKEVKNMFYNKEGMLAPKDIEQIQLQSIEKGITSYYPPETNISVVWAKVYNKKFIQKHNLRYIPNVVRMTDAMFNLEAFEKAKKIYVLQEYLYHYQKNDFAVCQRYSSETICYYETYINFLENYIKKYHKNEKFKDILNVKTVTSIDKYMYNYFFHKDNSKSNKEVTKEFKEILKKEMYQKAIKEVNTKYLGTYQKLVWQSAKNNSIIMLRILKKIKDSIKWLQGKKIINLNE